MFKRIISFLLYLEATFLCYFHIEKYFFLLSDHENLSKGKNFSCLPPLIIHIAFLYNIQKDEALYLV
jgi:hypothetical protein